MAAAQPTFGEAELNAEMPSVVRAMNDYIEGFGVPIIERHQDYGEAWGTGSFLKLGERIFILTNEHVARARSEIRLFPLSPQPDIHTDFEPSALCANRGAVDASKHCDS